MAFDLTIKDADDFTLRHIPRLLDLLQGIDVHMEEEYGDTLRSILELCADNLSEYSSDSLPQLRQVYRDAVSEALDACSQQIRVAREEWRKAVRESSED